MDPVTHLLAGVAGNRALGPEHPADDEFTPAERMALGGAFALFPDSDYLITLFADPLVYLNLHRGITHSLIFWPIWALLLGWLVARLWPQPRNWRDGARIAAISIGIHIPLDFLTNYGTQLFAPLSAAPLSFATTFIIDPWITLLLAAGLGIGLWHGRRHAPRIALVLVASLMLFQGAMKQHALANAESEAAARDLGPVRIHALPQPLSPLHWRLVVETPDALLEAHLGFGRAAGDDAPASAGPLRRHWAAFRPPGSLRWHRYTRFGGPADADFARTAWQRPGFAGFRRFAGLPYLWAVREKEGERCAVFTDLRFRTEGFGRPPFRFAMCRTAGDEWTLRQSGNGSEKE